MFDEEIFKEPLSLADEELLEPPDFELKSFHKGLQLLQRLLKSAKRHSLN